MNNQTRQQLADIAARIKEFEVDSAYPSSGCSAAGNDIIGILDLLADLVTTLQRDN